MTLRHGFTTGTAAAAAAHAPGQPQRAGGAPGAGGRPQPAQGRALRGARRGLTLRHG
jgi:hypothetical protein